MLFIVLGTILALYMTWGVGANDVANAMGTSVGSKAITVRKAIIVAAIFEFLGAFLAGGHVTGTIRKSIIDPSMIPNAEVLVVGMLAALLAAGVWLMVASWFGWPVSTTHTIVGSIIGFGMVAVGGDSVEWGKVVEIVASWLVSPVLGAVLALLLYLSVRRFILNTKDPMANARKYGPFYIFLMGTLISLVTVFKGLKHLNITLNGVETALVSLGFGLLITAVGKYLINRVKTDPSAEGASRFAGVEKIFAPLCVFTACSMAFAHGANDVANGIGPLAAIVSTVNTGAITQNSSLPLWILLVGGVGIVTGLATLGYRVMKTIGSKITELTPSRGFCAELAAATTVVIASRLGLPVSTTHIVVGAVLGVGLARGIAAIDLRTVAGIITSWLVTLPIGAALSALIFKAFEAILL